MSETITGKRGEAESPQCPRPNKTLTRVLADLQSAEKVGDLLRDYDCGLDFNQLAAYGDALLARLDRNMPKLPFYASGSVLDRDLRRQLEYVRTRL